MQRLARISARHPWRMIAAWGLILVASFLAIGALLGSALTTEADITARPDSVIADDLMTSNFPQGQAVDEIAIVQSPELTATDPAFMSFVEDFRASLESTGTVETVSDPYAEDAQGAISEDGHAVSVTLVMGDDPETGIEAVIDEVVAVDGDSGFDVAITGTYTLGYDFTILSESDLQKGELLFGLPAALIVLLLVFGAVVAALLPISIALGSIIVAVAISAVVGQATSLSFFIVNMITAMGLALGIDYSLFVLSRFREERLLGLDKEAAIVATGGTASKAVLFSGSSFVVGSPRPAPRARHHSEESGTRRNHRGHRHDGRRVDVACRRCFRFSAIE